MRIYDIIDKKAKHGVLSDEEIGFAVNGFVKNEISPAQMSSLLMAIRLISEISLITASNSFHAPFGVKAVGMQAILQTLSCPNSISATLS